MTDVIIVVIALIVTAFAVALAVLLTELLPVLRARKRPKRNRWTSQMCHVWTAPSWQGLSSRPRAGRCSHVFGLLVRFT
jgi:hypothetical protein